MKIIFLDVDGVLINRASCRSGFGKVDADCVALLNQLLEKSEAKIVVSSCWRIGKTVIEVRDLLNGWGVTPGKILDVTPLNWDWERGQEIGWWLDQRVKLRGDVESFVIIDDDRDMGDLLPRLVHTKFEPGLTRADVDAALELLNTKA